MPKLSRFLSLSVAISALWAGATPARVEAVEEVQSFIDRLMEQGGLEEYAVEYVERMRKSPLSSAEFKRNILYEKGKLVLEVARRTPDEKRKERLFDDAEKALRDFTAQAEGIRVGAQSMSELANVLVERGRIAVAKSERKSNAANKDKFLDEARKHFDEARKFFETCEKFYGEALKDKKEFPNALDPKDPKYDLRNEYRGEYVQARLFVGMSIYEKALTYKKDSADRKKLLTEASDIYGKLYENYHLWMAGQHARLYQGRCQQEMGDFKLALSYYEDLTRMDENDESFRPLIASTYVQIAQCLTIEGKHQQLVDQCGEWVKKARQNEERQYDFVEVKGYVMQSALKVLEESKDKTEKAKLENLVRDTARELSRFDNDWKERAQASLAKVGKGQAAPKADAEPKNFADAFDKAVEAINLMDESERAQPIAATAEEKKKIGEEAVKQRDLAVKYFELALSFVDKDSWSENKDKANFSRYYLALLYYRMGRFYEATVMSNFLIYNYPDSQGARPAAEISMASLQTLYNQPTNSTKDWEAGRIVDLSKTIASKWKGESEAYKAQGMLVSFLIQQGKFADAQKALAEIPPEFEGRGTAELKIGQEAWRQYLRGMRAPEEERLPQKELDAMRQLGQKTLEDGLTRMKEKAAGKANAILTNAQLALAQIYLGTKKAKEALALLEEKDLGPLSLVLNGDAIGQTPGFADSVYKTALRAYISQTPPNQEGAEKMMRALEDHASKSGGDKAQEALTLVYISLGLELQQQIGLSENDKDKQQLIKSFEVFLEKVKSGTGNTWSTLNWVASTYYNFGSSLDTGKKLSPEAKSYYAKAVDAYKKILEDVKANKIQAPSENSVLGLSLRLAECEARMGAYEEALDRLADILKTRPTMLDAQKSAAGIYQQRGRDKADFYRYAYLGGKKNKETGNNIIWGWAKLANIALKQPDPKYKDLFFESRYNLADCRLLYALKQKGAERKEYLEKGVTDIVAVYKLFPALGGGEWPAKYDALLKKIQKEQGDKNPKGLAGVELAVPGNGAGGAAPPANQGAAAPKQPAAGGAVAAQAKAPAAK